MVFSSQILLRIIVVASLHTIVAIQLKPTSIIKWISSLELASFRTAATKVAFVLEKIQKTRICACIAGMMYRVTSSLAFCKTVSFTSSQTIPLRLLILFPYWSRRRLKKNTKRFSRRSPVAPLETRERSRPTLTSPEDGQVRATLSRPQSQLMSLPS